MWCYAGVSVLFRFPETPARRQRRRFRQAHGKLNWGPGKRNHTCHITFISFSFAFCVAFYFFSVPPQHKKNRLKWTPIGKSFEFFKDFANRKIRQSVPSFIVQILFCRLNMFIGTNSCALGDSLWINFVVFFFFNNRQSPICFVEMKTPLGKPFCSAYSLFAFHALWSGVGIAFLIGLHSIFTGQCPKKA